MYSNNNEFTAVESTRLVNVTKTEKNGAVRYAVHQAQDEPENEGATLLSFTK